MLIADPTTRQLTRTIPGTLLGQDFLLGEIESSTAITGTYARWEYTVQPVRFANTSYLASLDFVDIGGTLSAINVAEFANTASNISGVDPDNLPTGFAAKPCKGFVICWPIQVAASSADLAAKKLTRYWAFALQTVIDGECP
jgi:hypothetical protein